MSPARLGTLALVALAAACAAPAAAPAATRAVSPGAPDAGDCLAAPCGSLGHAYRQSAPGDLVEVAAGDYGPQEIPAVAGRGGPAVTIRPAPGAAVRLADLDVHGPWVAIHDMPVLHDSIDVTGTGDVALVNLSATGLWVNDVRDLLVRGGGYGGKYDKTPVIIGGHPLSHRITFDGVDFHDAIATRSDTHEECLLAVSPQGLTIRNSIFRNCSYFGALISTCCGATRDPRDVLIENTVFERTYQWNRQPAPYSMMIGGIHAENFVFRHNTFQTEPAFNGTRLTNSRMVGNLGPLGSCQAAMTYAHNVWTTRRCGPADTHATDAMGAFVDPAAHDWHLRPGAAAIGRGHPTDHPATDRDGHPRDADPDAGADEYGNGPATTGAGAPGAGAGRPAAGGAPGRPRIVSARLGRRRICRVARRGCPARTRLRVRVSHTARITAQLRRAGRRRPARVVRRGARAGRTASLRVRARGLRRGRYRIRLVATDAAGRRSAPRTLLLRVR